MGDSNFLKLKYEGLENYLNYWIREVYRQYILMELRWEWEILTAVGSQFSFVCVQV